MKIVHLLIAVIAVFMVSCSGSQSSSNSEPAKDTITTASGLKYFYLKRGEGRQIEKGCEVKAYLDLKVKDSTVWNTDGLPDSVFAYFVGYDRLIKGFTEISYLLREGDEVVAIMPDSLAYGEKGSPNFVPPNATIAYNPMRIVSVSEPKLSLSEELYKVMETEGLEGVKSLYTIASTVDSAKYVGGLLEVFKLWEQLTVDEKHEDAADVATYFGNKENEIRLRYSAILSYEYMGNYTMALDSLKMIAEIAPGIPIVQQKMMELQMKIQSDSASVAE
ncbi:MAG: FKBP-type peptidyl-prolyl cis-trans isomerase [Bacteroidia bacterium]